MNYGLFLFVTKVKLSSQLYDLGIVGLTAEG